MKRISTCLFLVISAFLLISLCSCSKSKNNRASVITTPITQITNNSAMSGGNITNDQNEGVIDRGVCWSISHNPTIFTNKTSDGTGMFEFTSKLTGLTANTTYYVRAYVTTRPYEVDPYNGTTYGNEIEFKTLP